METENSRTALHSPSVYSSLEVWTICRGDATVYVGDHISPLIHSHPHFRLVGLQELGTNKEKNVYMQETFFKLYFI